MLARVARSLLAERLPLADFVRQSWPIVEPGTALLGNWHVDLICEYLEAVHLGQIRQLIINMPPRFGKSSLVTIAFPCWEWTADPTLRFMFASYAQNLCTKHSLDRRRVLQSDWYAKQWPLVRLAKDENLKSRFQNTATGHMITAPVGGTATGLGGRRLIIDDLMNPKKSESLVERETALLHYKNTLVTRLDDAATSATIAVEQRLGNHDLTGTLTRQHHPPVKDDEQAGAHVVNGWTKLVVPIEANIRTRYTFPRSGREKVFEVGELLDARRKSKADIAEMLSGQTGMGTRMGAAQLFQSPQDTEGLRFKRDWWKYLKLQPLEVTRSIWVWDTATKKNEKAAWSVGIKILRFPGGVCFTDLVRQRVEFPALKRLVRNNFLSDPADLILVEDRSSGQQLIQELARPDDGSAPLPIIGTDEAFNKMEKEQRAALVEVHWEAGRVYILEGGAWVEPMIVEYAEFPDGQFKDRVDAGVHGVHYLLGQNLVEPHTEPYEEAGDLTA